MRDSGREAEILEAFAYLGRLALDADLAYKPGVATRLLGVRRTFEDALAEARQERDEAVRLGSDAAVGMQDEATERAKAEARLDAVTEALREALDALAVLRHPAPNVQPQSEVDALADGAFAKGLAALADVTKEGE